MNKIQQNDTTIYSDASGIGLGAIYNSDWFSIPIPNAKTQQIHFWELAAACIAIETFKEKLSGKSISLYTDNIDVVKSIRKTSRQIRGGSLFAQLCTFLDELITKYDIQLHTFWIPGEDNVYADRASRLQPIGLPGMSEKTAPVIPSVLKALLSPLKRVPKLKPIFIDLAAIEDEIINSGPSSSKTKEVIVIDSDSDEQVPVQDGKRKCTESEDASHKRTKTLPNIPIIILD
jgi:hypothetical protein